MKSREHKIMTASAKDRRRVAIDARNAQLASGNKPYKQGREGEIVYDSDKEGRLTDKILHMKLTDKDRARIQKEIEVLQTRI